MRFLSVIGITILALVTIFAMNYYGLVSYKFFAPKFQEARREVWENTPSYVEGKRQQISKYKLEYETTEDDADRAAIKGAILQSVANVDWGIFPGHLRNFLETL